MSQFYLTALQLALCLSPMALGIFISMKVFNIPDITTDGSYTLGATVTAVMLSQHYPLGATLIVSMLAGALAGVCTGFIHSKLKIDALLSGILVMTALYSVNLIILGRSNVPLINVNTIFKVFSFSENNIIVDLIVSGIIVILILFLLGYLLRSDFGISMRATGNNPIMTTAFGINNNKIKIIGLALANSLTGLSGFLVSQYQGFSDINMGIGIVITGLGSVLIAGSLQKWFNITKIGRQLPLVVAGAIVFQMVLAFALSLGIDPNLLKLVTALFVLFIVAISAIGSKLKKN
jgi:putative ABC transport system permease protein